MRDANLAGRRDEASANLASLKFSQSNRAADPKDPTRIITTTTTTTFSMSREMAKGICQHFMDAHLIENAADLTSDTFKDRGVYMITPKGLHILERFITKNGISAEHLLKVFATQPICMKLLHLERRSQDDEILITKGVIEVLFKRFAGREPNVTKLNEDEILQQYSTRPHSKGPALPPGQELDRTLGIVVRKATTVERTASDTSNDEYIFSATAAADWLCDFTTITGRDEAAEIAAHFVRYGLITLVSDRKSKENAMIVSVRAGGPGGGAGAKFVSHQHSEARFH
jgi:predicted transcriptional regulator